MTTFLSNLFDIKNLKYSGSLVFIFAIIYYVILNNSYCNSKSALCKNPVLVTTELEPNKIIINKSTDSIIQHIKCEPMPDIDTTTYSTMTKKSIAIYASILGCILLLILFITNNKMQLFDDVIFRYIASGDKEIVNYSNYTAIIIVFITALVNFITTGYESKSLWILYTIIIAISIVYVIVSKQSNYYIKIQAGILVMLCIALLLIIIPNYKYINKLQVGHAFISTGSYVTLFIQLITVILIGITLAINYPYLLTNPIEYTLYVIIFIIILIQIGVLMSYIYHCVWKTYKCEPDFDIIKEKERDSDMDITSKIKINCSAKLNVGNALFKFIILAILFVILPSELVIDNIALIIDNINDGLEYVFDEVTDLLNM